MRTMIAWKFRRTVRARASYFLLAALALVAAVYIPLLAHDGARQAGELLCQVQAQLAAILVLFAGLYAAVCTSRDMQERFVSAAVAAGNSRASIVLAEFLGFAGAIFASVCAVSLLAFAAGAALFGLGGAAVAAAVLGAVARSALYALVCAAAFSTVLPLCFLVRGEGISCAANLIVLLVCWSGTQSLAELGHTHILSFMPFGQLFLLCGTELTAAAAMQALAVSAIHGAALLAVAYLILNRTELK